MAIEHSTIPDGKRHEPKGISTASAEQVYVADGAASGAWEFLDFELTASITGANSAKSVWLTVPYASKLIQAYAIVDAAFSADQTITFEVNGVAMTNGIIDLLNAGSAAGDIFSCSPSALNNVGTGEALEIVNAGGSASSFVVNLTLVFQRVG